MAVLTSTQELCIVLGVFFALVGGFFYGLTNKTFYLYATAYTTFGGAGAVIFGSILLASSTEGLTPVGYGVGGILFGTAMLSLGFGIGINLRNSKREPR